MKRKAKRIASLLVKPARKSLKKPVQNDDGFGTSMPPPFALVEIYFDQKSMAESVCDFYDENELRQWKNQTGQPITNWKVCAAEWIYNYRQQLKRKFRQSTFYSESFTVKDFKQIQSKTLKKEEIAFFSNQQDVRLYYKRNLALPSEVSSGHGKTLRSRIFKIKSYGK